METGPALFGLQYQVAKMRGRRGDAGFAQWFRMAQKVERERAGALVARVPSAEEAVSVLARESRPLFKKQGVAVAAEGYLTSLDGGDRESLAEYRAHLEKLRPGAAAALGPRRQQKVHGDASASANLVLPPGATFTWVKRTYGANGVTTVSAKGSRASHAKPFQYYVEHADPRNWAKYYKPSFQQTYQTIADPTNPLRNPPPAAPVKGVDGAWKGRLFEVARLELMPGDDLTEFRDILDIVLTLSDVGQPQTLSLTYSLSECLTTSVLGIENEGGLDVDSGHGCVTCTGGVRGPIDATAEKNIRFTSVAAFSEELNLFALPFLIVWMRALILGTLGINDF